MRRVKKKKNDAKQKAVSTWERGYTRGLSSSSPGRAQITAVQTCIEDGKGKEVGKFKKAKGKVRMYRRREAPTCNS
jgi:hypothetical protein